MTLGLEIKKGKTIRCARDSCHHLKEGRLGRGKESDLTTIVGGTEGRKVTWHEGLRGGGGRRASNWGGGRGN